jgi:hypothetical protein
MVPSRTRVLIPITDGLETHNFTTWGLSTCLTEEPTPRVCSCPTMKFCQRRGQQAWTHHRSCHISRHQGHPEVGRGGRGRLLHFFIRNLLHKLREGHLNQAANNWTVPCATDPKTSEERRNALMRNAGSTTNKRGSGDKGGAQNTQERGRQPSGGGEARAAGRRASCRPQRSAAYLTDVMTSPSCPTPPRPRPMLGVRSLAWAAAGTTATAPLLRHSATRARPHTPRARAAPGKPAPCAHWRQPEGGRTLRPGGRLEFVPQRHGHGAQPVRLVPARWRAGGLGGL